MSKTKKILITVAASLAGLLIVVIVASVFILQSSWFANTVRDKIVASGGGVERRDGRTRIIPI